MPGSPRAVSFRAQVDAELRTETLFGVEHLVVPVVALVEGVLQGMNAATPELALSSEFGRVPEGWNGRPVVMNHPIVDNNAVSANSPTVLETYAFGQLFNTQVEDGKLKSEAWINLNRVKELGGEIATTVDRIQNGTVVEVSTGLFTQLEEVSGRFNNKDYAGIWRNIVPDHLAFLSEGVKGACSVEDGCGTPRVNMLNSGGQDWTEYSMLKTNSKVTTSASPCDCGCGGACDGDKAKPKPKAFSLQRLVANAFPAEMFSRNVSKLLEGALTALYDDYIYVIGFTQEHVVYERWDSKANTFAFKRRSFTISDDKSVTLGDDEEGVTILTEIVVDGGGSSTQPKVAANGEESTMADKLNTSTEGTETDPKATAAGGETQGTQGTPGGNGEQGQMTEPTQPTVSAAAQEPAKPAKPKTLSDFLNDLPEEMREVMKSGIKLHNQKKSDLISGLRASGRCKFTDEQLQGMQLEMLENLAELAAVPTFEGNGSPKVNASGDDDDQAVPAPIAVFTKKSA